MSNCKEITDIVFLNPLQGSDSRGTVFISTKPFLLNMKHITIKDIKRIGLLKVTKTLLSFITPLLKELEGIISPIYITQMALCPPPLCKLLPPLTITSVKFLAAAVECRDITALTPHRKTKGTPQQSQWTPSPPQFLLYRKYKLF
jgi:hypothetical protein